MRACSIVTIIAIPLVLTFGGYPRVGDIEEMLHLAGNELEDATKTVKYLVLNPYRIGHG